MKKTNVAVIFGGKSPEYEVSLVSGREVVKNLNPKYYNVLPIIIDKNGMTWRLVSRAKLLSSEIKVIENSEGLSITDTDSREIGNINNFLNEKIDVVFIAMHGPYGEDGTIQGMLEFAGLKYTGSKVLASALGMDKIMFKKVLKASKIAVPEYVEMTNKEKFGKIYKSIGEPPYFIKPHNQGSSVGSSIVKSRKDLENALSKAFKYSKTALVEEFIKGKEVTCPVLGNESPRALPVIEIIPNKGEFFDYESKYSDGGALEIVPARISKEITKRVQQIAINVYKLIGCRGFARIDFILKDNRYPICLEINTIPGLTPASLFPKSAKAAGISYSDLLDQIINYALH
jgi:D-alanine-D-alanine ligase